VPALVEIADVAELNIGHAVVSDAVFVGLRGAVAGYLAAIEAGVARRKR
jgi:pyridoxine 5'-phosphate synthase PdxJ